MAINLVISSGKGGTGKTFISTNIARVLEKRGEQVRYLDCDVEEPNGHLFLKPEIGQRAAACLLSPMGVDETRCTACGRCVEVCKYNALALINKSVLFFKNLCHICGACSIVCPAQAITEKERKIGELIAGKSGSIDVFYALLETGEGGMSPRLIRKVKEHTGDGINILDSPPGTACPVVETVKDADLCVLVTDPTPFGVNDLTLAVAMCRELGKEPVVLVNRAEYLDNALKDYCQNEDLEIIGEIPDERKIAECYSVGELAVEKFAEYHELFTELALKILSCAKNRREVRKRSVKSTVRDAATQKIVCNVQGNMTGLINGKELVVISGKGGTGKTSLVAAFCALEKKLAIADCDVDAADLHLVLKPVLKEQGSFSGGQLAVIDKDKCVGCGACEQACRFAAIREVNSTVKRLYQIDELSCEGCGVCSLVCGMGAVTYKQAINGEWYISDTRFGPLSHAKLGIVEENSGKLVSLIRKKKIELASLANLHLSIIDGSPGTGCPVIASITGTDYAVVVTEPTVSGIHDLKRILDVTRFFRIRSGIIVNKYDLNPAQSQAIKAIAEQEGADFLGEISYDKAFTLAQLQGMSVIEYTDNRITQELKGIWENIKKNADKEEL